MLTALMLQPVIEALVHAVLSTAVVLLWETTHNKYSVGKQVHGKYISFAFLFEILESPDHCVCFRKTIS